MRSKVRSRFIVIIIAVISIVSYAFNVNKNINTGQGAYNKDRVVLKYDEMITLSTAYPEIAMDIQPYYDYMQSLIDTFHKSEEDVNFDYSITIVDDALWDVWLSANIKNDKSGSVLPINIYHIASDYPYELRVSADYYNIAEADINDTIYIESYAIAEIFGIEEGVIKEYIVDFFKETYINYYRPASMDITIQDINYQLNYNGKGDLFFLVRKPLILE